MRRRLIILGVMAVCGGAGAQDREVVTFQISQTTTVGQSVYVLGDVAELGGNDLTRAVKMEPGAYPVWKAAVSLPKNTSYAYRYYLRSDAPSQQRVTTNGTAVGTVLAGSTSAAALSPPAKAVVFRSAWASPLLRWRLGGAGAYSSTTMVPFGAGRAGTERAWIANGVAAPRSVMEFYFTAADGAGRDPAAGVYSTRLDAMLVQDGQVYTYWPAASVGAVRRDYNPASPPSIASTNLGGEVRAFRVLLPRGYDQHSARRYPVIYMHDGQNVFDQGPFGTWAADQASATQVGAGAMRECIIVGVDNTSNRIPDYTPPHDGGRADRYTRFLLEELKPRIDAQYRTLTGAADTGAIGSSMGALVSLYMGWEFTGSVTRVGAMSGAWQVGDIDGRVGTQAKRPIRIWLDSGDSGTSDDNYWLTYNLRDALIRPTHTGGNYAESGDLKHMIGFNQQHNEAAWSQRVGPAFSFLFPAAEEASVFTSAATGAAFDVDGDGRVTVEDVYRQYATPRDVNGDGAVDVFDAGAVVGQQRRGERAGMGVNR